MLDAFSARVRSTAKIKATPELLEDARPAIRTVLEQLGPVAESAGVALTLEADCDPPRPITGNGRRLGRVVQNLVENAIRHSPDGGKVTVGLTPTEEGLRFTVDDVGPGIRPEDRQRIFAPFSQGSGATKGRVGLGLYFCRITIERWGGQLEAENRDPGTRFWFAIPWTG